MKRNPFSLAVILTLVSSGLTTQALAFESLLGDYEGKIKYANGYNAKVDDACAVTIGTSDLYGGSVSFEIQNAEKLTVEKRRVEADFKAETPEIKWGTPNTSTRTIEVVTLNLSNDGKLQQLKLVLKYPSRHQENTVACGDLARKQ